MAERGESQSTGSRCEMGSARGGDRLRWPAGKQTRPDRLGESEGGRARRRESGKRSRGPGPRYPGDGRGRRCARLDLEAGWREAIVECWLLRREKDPLTVAVRCLGGGEAPGEGWWEIQDLTRLRAVEAEVQQLSHQLTRANRELEDLHTRIERNAGEREELLTVVSHELRTPITVIAGFNKLLLAEKVGSLTKEQRHFLSESAKSCRRLSAFIGNLIEAAREVAGERPLELVETSLGATIEGVVEFLKPLLDERRQTLESRSRSGRREGALRSDEGRAGAHQPDRQRTQARPGRGRDPGLEPCDRSRWQRRIGASSRWWSVTTDRALPRSTASGSSSPMCGRETAAKRVVSVSVSRSAGASSRPTAGPSC